jgi:hypothetical protein
MKAATEHVASVLKRARCAAGLTQTELATLIGTDQSAISAYEGAAKRPSASTVRNILLTIRPRPSVTLYRHRDEVLAVMNEYGIERPRVFGSVARGTDTWRSDIDFLVTVRREPGASVLRRMFALIERLERIFGPGRVDLFEDSSLPQGSAIKRDAIPL